MEAYASSQPNRVIAIPSLGQLRYLSAVKHAAAVIGNSSSGIIEVPAFDVPTVNIGDRQKDGSQLRVFLIALQIVNLLLTLLR